jgi:S-adenosylmethionine hydrolase
VTLLTDFGTVDPFVGVMKGVLLRGCPSATLIDLTHDVEPQSVRAGAFWLGQAYPWFPPATVHLAVVDPGVGTTRRGIVARADGYLFVAPDNGLLEVVTRHARDFEAREIDLERLDLVPRSRTFHGRDVFAPVAAALAEGSLAFEDVGPGVTPIETTFVPDASLSERSAAGEVLVVDRFGNLITNVGSLPLHALTLATVRILGHELKIVGTYGELDRGACGAVVGSFGQLEIVARESSAARHLGAMPRTPVLVDW